MHTQPGESAKLAVLTELIHAHRGACKYGNSINIAIVRARLRSSHLLSGCSLTPKQSAAEGCGHTVAEGRRVRQANLFLEKSKAVRKQSGRPDP